MRRDFQLVQKVLFDDFQSHVRDEFKSIRFDGTTDDHIKAAIYGKGIIIALNKSNEPDDEIIWGYSIYLRCLEKKYDVEAYNQILKKIGLVIEGDQKQIAYLKKYIPSLRGMDDPENKTPNEIFNWNTKDFWHWYFLSGSEGIEKLYEALHYAWIACYENYKRVESGKELETPEKKDNNGLDLGKENSNQGRLKIACIGLGGILRHIRLWHPEINGTWCDVDGWDSDHYYDESRVDELDTVREEQEPPAIWSFLAEQIPMPRAGTRITPRSPKPKRGEDDEVPF